ncbi:hypothetical protein Ct9H90mP29_19670 [bacterium]|nr:MAG: hypothetical protein Ct9H90mP29_19670 [bacterium]
MSYKFIFIFISILTINLSAQIVGTVIDISKGEPIFGANIVVMVMVQPPINMASLALIYL